MRGPAATPVQGDQLVRLVHGSRATPLASCAEGSHPRRRALRLPLGGRRGRSLTGRRATPRNRASPAHLTQTPGDLASCHSLCHPGVTLRDDATTRGHGRLTVRGDPRGLGDTPGDNATARGHDSLARWDPTGPGGTPGDNTSGRKSRRFPCPADGGRSVTTFCDRLSPRDRRDGIPGTSRIGTRRLTTSCRGLNRPADILRCLDGRRCPPVARGPASGDSVGWGGLRRRPASSCALSLIGGGRTRGWTRPALENVGWIQRP
jgi:hypothetical protein